MNESDSGNLLTTLHEPKPKQLDMTIINGSSSFKQQNSGNNEIISILR